ncbi:MAG: tetratricopeptide repeat protein [Flavobacteriales bacterium]|nr:tetratricopeptide repeat protein [Flavobacteriales bacterium]
MRRISVYPLLIQCVLLIAFIHVGFAQTALDSLVVATSEGHDTSRVQAYAELCRQLRNTDTERAIAYGEQGCALAASIQDANGEAVGRQTLANAFIIAGNYGQALRELHLANDLNRRLGNRQREAACLSNLGIIHLNLGNLSKALEHHTSALALREELQDSAGIANSFNNLGVLYTELGNHAQALVYYSSSLDMKRKLGQDTRLAVNLNNIAVCHREMGETAKAKELFLQSLDSYHAQGDLHGEAMVLGNLGNLSSQTGLWDDARDYHNRALRLQKQVGDPEGAALEHLSLSEWHGKKGGHQLASAHADTALQLATEIGSIKLMRDANLRLSESHEQVGNIVKGLFHLKAYHRLNEELSTEEASRQMAELETRLETARIESELDVLKAENELNLQRIVFEKRVGRATLGLLIMALLLIGISAYAYRRKKQDNLILEEKNTIIGQKNLSIVQSIQYAQRIQRAVITSEAALQLVLPGSLLLFRPKDIVSGDFFWVAKQGGRCYAAVADCTGHGVPGAFVSIVGHTELSKALRELNDPSPMQILTYLDQRIRETLRNEEDNQVSDGMDICLTVLDPATRQLSFCGALRPLMVFSTRALVHERAQVVEGADGFLHIIPASRRPVGKTDRDTPFEGITLQLIASDRVFLYSDGFADQFGGAQDRKFGNRPFRELLLATSVLPTNEQQQQLEKTLDDWMAATSQTDDICVLGFTVG